MPVVFLAAGPRSVLLYHQAYEEEGLGCPDVDERVEPTKLLYPRSFVEGVNALPDDKRFDYSFMGALYRPEVFPHRAWVLDFARRRFTDRSHLVLSESPPEHRRLGSFDHTTEAQGVWVPKEVPWGERDYFNPVFFQVLRQSQFALCPAGDLPWSQRFFEAVMCRSIPIVSDPEHAGRHDHERAIGYRMYLADDEHVYDEDIVEENYELFLRHQTLTGAQHSA
ncbi:MAG: exostosin family protein [Acidimicrobiales bacterium]